VPEALAAAEVNLRTAARNLAAALRLGARLPGAAAERHIISPGTLIH
jgi:hypothetical protein